MRHLIRATARSNGSAHDSGRVTALRSAARIAIASSTKLADDHAAASGPRRNDGPIVSVILEIMHGAAKRSNRPLADRQRARSVAKGQPTYSWDSAQGRPSLQRPDVRQVVYELPLRAKSQTPASAASRALYRAVQRALLLKREGAVSMHDALRGVSLCPIRRSRSAF